MRENIGLYRGFHEDESGKEEIVLNGKKIRGEWVEGYYWTNELGNHFIKVVRDNENNFVKDPITNDYEVLKETVGQYVGLIDKNGNKIFEGDRLLCRYGCEQMDISEGTYESVVKYEKFCHGSEIGFLRGLPLTGCLEVIGNIYETKQRGEEE